jgi:hypothetical protein
MGKSKKIAIENYQKFQSVAHWSHWSEKKSNLRKMLPIGLTVAHWSLLPIGLTHCIGFFLCSQGLSRAQSLGSLKIRQK